MLKLACDGCQPAGSVRLAYGTEWPQTQIQAWTSTKYGGDIPKGLYLQATHLSHWIRRCAEDGLKTGLTYSVLIGQTCMSTAPSLEKSNVVS